MTKYCFCFLVLLSACSTKGKKADFVVNLEEGKILYEGTCKTCHGAFGEGSNKFKSPALVNLDGAYLHRQLINFRNDTRGNVETDTLGKQMAAMAKTIKDTVAVRNIVAYINSMPQVETTEQLSGDWKSGERIYQGLCGSCHGPEGKGNPKLNAPQLNGLASWYMKSQFEKFKNGQRGAHPNDKFGSQMAAIVQVLQDDQSLTDVIAYLRSELPAASK